MLFRDRRNNHKTGETKTVSHKGKKYTVTRDSDWDIQVSGPDGDFEAAPRAKGNLYENKRGNEVKQTAKAIKKGKVDQIKLPPQNPK